MFIVSYVIAVLVILSVKRSCYNASLNVEKLTNPNLGKPPFLENMFLTSWASECLGMHTQAIMHPCLSFPDHSCSRGGSLTHLKLLSSLSHTTSYRFFISPCSKFIFCVVGKMGINGPQFRGLRRLFFLCRKYGSFPHVFYAFSLISPSSKTHFCVV